MQVPKQRTFSSEDCNILGKNSRSLSCDCKSEQAGQNDNKNLEPLCKVKKQGGKTNSIIQLL